jgi:type IV pilus assembly protein PilW
MNSIFNTNRSSRHNLRTRARFRGVSLVELMIAMTISLFVIGALLGVVMGASSTSKSRDFNAELQNNGRYALEVIKNDLQQSGYLGVSSIFFPDVALPDIPPPGAPITTVLKACDPATIGRISQRVWGSNDINPFANTCISSYSAGDILLVRGLSSEPVTGALSPAQVYYYSTYDKGFAFLGPTPPVVTLPGKIAPSTHLLQENVFYVSPFTDRPNESPLIPSLHRVRLGAGPAMGDELVAGGVEQMQFTYGLLLSNGKTVFKSADAIGPTEWDAVKSVRVWLLLRSSRPEAGLVNNNTYDMGDITFTPPNGADNYRRLLLDAVVALRNN